MVRKRNQTIPPAGSPTIPRRCSRQTGDSRVASITWCDYPTPLTCDFTTSDQRIAGLTRLIVIIIALFVLGAVAQRPDVLRHDLDGSARAAPHARGTVRANPSAVAGLLLRARSRRHDEPDHQRHRYDPAGASFALVNVISGMLLLIWVAYNMLTPMCRTRCLRLASCRSWRCDVLLLGPGAQGLPRQPPADGQRQRRTAGKHRRRARSAGLQPRGREHRAVPAQPTPPTAMRTCAPLASPAR